MLYISELQLDSKEHMFWNFQEIEKKEKYLQFIKLSNLHYTNKQRAYNIEIKNIKRNYYTCTEPYEPLHNKYKINDKKTNLITQS